MNEQRPLFSDITVTQGSSPKSSVRRPGVAACGAEALQEWLQSERTAIDDRMAALEESLRELTRLVLSEQTIKESYSTQEVAVILGKRPYTVREWCRLNRVHAYKAEYGRGSEDEWRIRHEELVRIQNEGLLPLADRN